MCQVMCPSGPALTAWCHDGKTKSAGPNPEEVEVQCTNRDRNSPVLWQEELDISLNLLMGNSKGSLQLIRFLDKRIKVLP